MYLVINTSKHPSGNVYHSVLLRESYREGKKVKKRTIANLSNCTENEINWFRDALKNKRKSLESAGEGFEIHQGRSIGGVYVLYQLAEKLGIVSALGDTFHAKLAIWLIISRIIEQGSRLSATRLDAQYDIASAIALERGFDENNLYDCLRWLSENQCEIENSLFKRRDRSQKFLWYDVTSSYLEGAHNQLAAFGYDRDKKKRKRIIVIGLLCLNDGDPIAIEAFRGNTQDTLTFESQLIKLKNRFGCESVTMICDRGLIREKQKKLLGTYGFHYITALPMPQILTLINANFIKLTDFTNELKSFYHRDIRYIYRRNPERASETQKQRQERFETAERKVDQENERLRKLSKASPYTAKRRIQKILKTLCVNEWVDVSIIKGQLVLQLDPEKLTKKAAFDGCYIWTTDLSKDELNDREVYERYKDLKYVEDDFRSFKTNFLEVRPIFVRSEASTRGHLVVVMLAHMILRELRRAWTHFDGTVDELLGKLNLLCLNTIQFSDGRKTQYIPIPDDQGTALLKAVDMTMPRNLEERKVPVVTRRKVRKFVTN